MKSVAVLFLLLSFASASDPHAPDFFLVRFETDVPGAFVLNVTRSQAPIGVDHFAALVEDKFYNQAAFFRVVPGFVVQFGIAGEPAENKRWSKAISDDPVAGSNTKGTVSYATAGPNTRTSQLFVNLVDNTRLDKMGFAPFAYVTQGLDVVEKIFNPTPGDSGGIDQGKYTADGNPWLKQQYPKTNFITRAVIEQ